MSWNSSRLVARLASARPSPSRTPPLSTTGSGPKRSVSMPQPKEAIPIVRKTIVMAPDTPVRDQPVASAIGCRNTASENTAPIATHPNRPPAATTIQP